MNRTDGLEGSSASSDRPRETGSSEAGPGEAGPGEAETSETGAGETGPRLTEALVELLESGVSMAAGTCGAELEPECVRGLGAHVSPDRRRVTLLLNGALCERLRCHVADNPRIAVAFSRIHDHHTIQLKGRVLSIRDGDEDDEAAVARYLVAFAEQLALAGLPRSVVRQVRCCPCIALTLVVEEIFDQTPGPEAGRRLAAS